MEAMTIIFPNGNRARAVQVSAGADGAALAAVLELPPPRAVLLLSGGASAIPSTGMDQLRYLLVEGVARLAAEEGITVIDGGTQAGVMRMMGEGWATAGADAPLIGVCPAALVSWPGGPTGSARVPLEPHHTHFILTGGDSWGDETEVMFALAAALSHGVSSVAVLANGGPIARREVLHNVHQRREIIVIAGSGRLADELTAIVRRQAEPADADVTKVVQDGRITLFEISQTPSELADLVAQKIGIR